MVPDREATAAATRAGIALMLAAMFAFALMDGLTKKLTATLPITQIMWTRQIVFAAIAVIWFWRAGLQRALATTRPLLQGSRALLLLIESACFIVAFKFLPLADVHAVAASTPLFVVALSVPFLGEKIGPRRMLAVLLGLAGVLIIVRPGLVTLSWPMLLALIGAVLWGVYQIMVRILARTDNGDTMWVWNAMVGLAATSLVGPFHWVPPDATAWVLLVLVALLGAGAHIAMIKAITLAAPVILQPFTYMLFVWAVVVGYVMFGDMPDHFTLAGTTLIIASGLYAWHRERVRAREAMRDETKNMR
jgi:drug/metabolite transporter (DMT)-like permease